MQIAGTGQKSPISLNRQPQAYWLSKMAMLGTRTRRSTNKALEGLDGYKWHLNRISSWLRGPLLRFYGIFWRAV